MRILVTGSRSWDDMLAISTALHTLTLGYDSKVTLIHGNARGLDKMAARFAEGMGWNIWSFPAEWNYYGKAAGPHRNIEMLDTMKPDICVAFPKAGSVGTWHCVREAEKRGIPVHIRKG